MELENIKHDFFCTEYSVDFNVKRAAEVAGMSTATAYKILETPAAQARIRELVLNRVEKSQMTAEDILVELTTMADLDIADLYDENNCLKKVSDMPASARRCIASIETAEIFEGYGEQRQVVGTTVKLKLWDKNKALELLGKYHKLFVDRRELEVGQTLAGLLARSWDQGQGNGQRQLEQPPKLIDVQPSTPTETI